MVTSNAGSSTNQKRSIGALIVALLAVAALSAQTGQPLGGPKFTAQLNNGDPCNGCKLFAYVGGTTTKQDTYTTSAISVANANPVVLDSAGRATVFLDPTKVYKFVLAPSTDTDPPASPLWTVDNVTGQFSGVVTVTAANTRGIQVTRSGANAGISLTSSGGSGKTYGIVSDTAGALSIQDDSDSTPQIKISGNNITNTLTGTFTVSGGAFVVNGFGQHAISNGGTGAQQFIIRNTTAGTGNISVLDVGNDADAALFRMKTLSSTYTSAAADQANGGNLESNGAGGLSLSAKNAAGDIRLYTGATPSERARFKANGAFFIGQTTGTRDVEMRSTGDGLTGGFVVTRSDGSELLVNADDGAPGGGFGTIQARDGSGYLQTKLSPSGGGVSVGGGTAFLSVLTGTSSWDPGSMINGAMQSTTVTVTGVQSTSPCIAGYWPNTGGTTLNGQSLSAYYDSANTVRVVLVNTSGSTNDPSSATVRVTCFTY